MGTWGHLSFQNDGALEWTRQLATTGIHAIRAVLERVATITPDAYVDVAQATAAIAAAEVVAAARGHACNGLPDAAESWLGDNAGSITTGDAILACRALERIYERSELQRLWIPLGPENPWGAEIRALLDRLVADPKARRRRRTKAIAGKSGERKPGATQATAAQSRTTQSSTARSSTAPSSTAQSSTVQSSARTQEDWAVRMPPAIGLEPHAVVAHPDGTLRACGVASGSLATVSIETAAGSSTVFVAICGGDDVGMRWVDPSTLEIRYPKTAIVLQRTPSWLMHGLAVRCRYKPTR